MKILVTGHKGFIGSNLLIYLSSDGHHVVGYEYGDGFPDVKGFDWVIHAGAITSTTETNVEKITEQNILFSLDLLESCIKHKVNFQFSSSASVYGLKNEFNIDSPVDPRTPYAWSKYFFEVMAKERMNDDILIQIFRYFNVYGQYEERKGSQASPFCQFKQQAVEHKKIKVFENSENYKRDFIHVNSVVNLHKRFFNVKESGLWNFGIGSTMSFLEVAEFYKWPGVSIEVVPMPENLKNSYQTYTCADMSETFKVLEKYGC